MINKSIFTLLVIFICALSVEAFAQAPELFVRPEPNDPTDLEQLLDEVPDREAPQPKPTDINEFAQQYYQNCLKQDHESLSGESLELLCTCTAAKIPENMTMRQTYHMQQNTNQGRLQRIRFMEFVYTPCLRYPVTALVEQRCRDNKEISKKYRNYKAICGCVGDRMGDFMDDKSPGYVDLALRRNLPNIDPLEMLLDSEQFTKRQGLHMRYCVDVYEYGKK